MTFDSCISPLDYRYLRNKKAHNAIMPYFSEESYTKYKLRVESALAEALAKHNICSKKVADEIAGASEKVTAEEVFEEEERIKHDIRALANCIRNKVSEEAKPFVHFLATSYDIVDTANALRYKEFSEKELIPLLNELERELISIAEREKNTLQIGRTHGQHAEPITFGFAIASYVNRVGSRIETITNAKNALCGKMSGAVGAYNASSVIFENAEDFEKTTLDILGIKPALHSTQIVPPEPIADLAHAAVSTFSVLANFSDDMRNLQRSEISEVGELFGKDQVGSSTMPHKRNPITFENIKSIYKAFMPRMTTVYLDQISEHQRDLTNSASQRFLPELFGALYASILRITDAVKKLSVDKEHMNANFNKSKEHVAAEPLYILLAKAGHPDAHEAVRKLTLLAQKEEKGIVELAENDSSLKNYIEKISSKNMLALKSPEKYIGRSTAKTDEVCTFWKNKLKL